MGFKLSAPVHQLDFVIAWSQEQLDFYEYTLEILMLPELEHISHWLYVVVMYSQWRWSLKIRIWVKLDLGGQGKIDKDLNQGILNFAPLAKIWWY